MKVARWYYVKEPVFPPRVGVGSQFHHPAMYAEILQVVKENPGLTRREIAAKLDKKTKYVDSLLWRLRKYTGALHTEVVGYVRTPGREEFEKVPAVQRMLSKLGSSKTRDPWLRRLFRYERWLQERGYFESITEALEDYKNAKDQERRYYHVDLLGEFLNSWKASKGTKDSIVTVIRGFYWKNRADLPREKIVYAREMLLDTPGAGEQYVKPEEWWRIINDGHVPARDKAIPTLIGLLPTGKLASRFIVRAPGGLTTTAFVYSVFSRLHGTGSCSYSPGKGTGPSSKPLMPQRDRTGTGVSLHPPGLTRP